MKNTVKNSTRAPIADIREGDVIKTVSRFERLEGGNEKAPTDKTLYSVSGERLTD